MKTLFDLCKPRQSVFDETKREDVLNLSDLLEGNIDPVSFFEENYLTSGMNPTFRSLLRKYINFSEKYRTENGFASVMANSPISK